MPPLSVVNVRVKQGTHVEEIWFPSIPQPQQSNINSHHQHYHSAAGSSSEGASRSSSRPTTSSRFHPPARTFSLPPPTAGFSSTNQSLTSQRTPVSVTHKRNKQNLINKNVKPPNPNELRKDLERQVKAIMRQTSRDDLEETDFENLMMNGDGSDNLDVSKTATTTPRPPNSASRPRSRQPSISKRSKSPSRIREEVIHTTERVEYLKRLLNGTLDNTANTGNDLIAGVGDCDFMESSGEFEEVVVAAGNNNNPADMSEHISVAEGGEFNPNTLLSRGSIVMGTLASQYNQRSLVTMLLPPDEDPKLVPQQLHSAATNDVSIASIDQSPPSVLPRPPSVSSSVHMSTIASTTVLMRKRSSLTSMRRMKIQQLMVVPPLRRGYTATPLLDDHHQPSNYKAVSEMSACDGVQPPPTFTTQDNTITAFNKEMSCNLSYVHEALPLSETDTLSALVAAEELEQQQHLYYLNRKGSKDAKGLGSSRRLSFRPEVVTLGNTVETKHVPVYVHKYEAEQKKFRLWKTMCLRRCGRCKVCKATLEHLQEQYGVDHESEGGDDSENDAPVVEAAAPEVNKKTPELPGYMKSRNTSVAIRKTEKPVSPKAMASSNASVALPVAEIVRRAQRKAFEEYSMKQKS